MSEPIPANTYHVDGSPWAVGHRIGETPVGFWEWFRQDGTRSRAGAYDETGKQVGEWTTYDKTGAVFKVTRFK